MATTGTRRTHNRRLQFNETIKAIIKASDYIREHREDWLRGWNHRSVESYARELSAHLGVEVSPRSIRKLTDSAGFPRRPRVNEAPPRKGPRNAENISALNAVVSRLAAGLGDECGELRPFLS